MLFAALDFLIWFREDLDPLLRDIYIRTKLNS